MLTRLDLRGDRDPASRLPRPEDGRELPLEAVRAIIAEVRRGGDEALRQLTARFDNVEVSELAVPPSVVRAALDAIPAPLLAALEASREAILDFHRHLHGDSYGEPAAYRRDGITVREIRRPVARAGLYAPGGAARYPSTVLMTAVPAKVAGVSELALCVPPGPGGEIPAETLAAAALAEVDEVYRVGGAQAVAALAYGTESIAPVDVVAGPGNIYVSLAKREVAGVVGVPSSFAGPSEVVVVADETAPPALAAIDVVVQAEHGPGGLAWLVTWSEKLADEVSAEVERAAEASPRRAELHATLGAGGYAVLVDGPEEAMEVANAVAPEHLELMTADPASLVPLVSNAGAVFTGAMSPASIGDYIAGPSHVLPTHRSARFASALGVEDFVKRIHVVSLESDALEKVGAHVVAIAEAEGLPAHAESVRRREAR